MTTIQVPDTHLVIESSGKEWAIWETVDDEHGDPEVNVLIDCGHARTRWGMKAAVLRRIIPMMFANKYQRRDQKAAEAAGLYAAKEAENG